MSKSPFFYLATGIATVMLCIISGCIGRSLPSRLYTLTPIPESAITSSGQGHFPNAAVGIGPVKLADYLDQSGIVTRIDDNRIGQAEYDYWSGSLRDNLNNVLAENIGYLLETARVFLYPWRSYVPIDYQVTADIVRFDGQLGKEAILVARWSVLNKEDTVLAMKRSEITEKTAGGGYEAFVAAQSRALARLSSEIAETIKSVESEQQSGR